MSTNADLHITPEERYWLDHEGHSERGVPSQRGERAQAYHDTTDDRELDADRRDRDQQDLHADVSASFRAAQAKAADREDWDRSKPLRERVVAENPGWTVSDYGHDRIALNRLYRTNP